MCSYGTIRTRSFSSKERVFHYTNASQKVEKSVFTTQSFIWTTRSYPFFFLNFFPWVVGLVIYMTYVKGFVPLLLVLRVMSDITALIDGATIYSLMLRSFYQVAQTYFSKLFSFEQVEGCSYNKYLWGKSSPS